MKTNTNLSPINAVLILIAAISLFTMLSLNQINYIVHNDLYNYGLRFSYRWAMPYWVFSGIIFGLCWFNITLSIIVTLYIFKKSRKSSTIADNIPQAENTEVTTLLKEQKEQRKLSEYVELQGAELAMPKEEPVETSGEELIEEEVKQPEETVETVEVQETQANRQKVEEEAESHEETEEVSIPPEDIEKRQSIL